MPPSRIRRLVAVAVLLLCPIFVRLGLWQIDRAHAGEALAQTIAERTRQPPIVLAGPLLPADETLLYRKAVVRGRYEYGDRILLDNRKSQGRLGYHLIVPLKIDGSDVRVLVNCGWIARDDIERECGHQSVTTGLIVRPSVPPLRLSARQEGWHDAWPYLDLSYFESLHRYPVQPFVLIRDLQLIEETVHSARVRSDRRGMHIGYAIQWFVFAALALALFVFLLINGNRG